MTSLADFPIRRRVRERIETARQEFLAEFYGLAVRRRPTDVELLAELAMLLSGLGRFEEGLAIDEQLVELVPGHPVLHYNLACSQALVGRKECALASLKRSIELGYDDPTHLAADEDLRSLRGEPEFVDLLARLSRAGDA